MATASKPKRSKKSAANGSVNKAEEIRKAAKEIGGKKVRPKDVIALLATRGITVAPAQVSSTLKAAGYRRLRKPRSAPAAKGHRGSAPGELSIEHLLAAKALIGRLGSVEAAKKAIDVLANSGDGTGDRLS